MGLPMNNLHAPTVPSGPSSGPQGNDSTPSKLSLLELFERKDGLEEELKALGAVLDSVSRPGCRMSLELTGYIQHGVNMNTSLTTFDGYPRDDIDVAQSTKECSNQHHSALLTVR
jgi:26S proteasome regulatory subunit N4